MLSPLESWALILGLVFLVLVGSGAAWWLLSRPRPEETSDLAVALAELRMTTEKTSAEIGRALLPPLRAVASATADAAHAAARLYDWQTDGK